MLPCGKNKIPLVSWKEFQTRYPSETEVKSWYEKFPEGQVGIITGKISNLTVVDVEKGGDPSFLPQDTTIVSTGGNGYHYFFLFEEGVTNKARIKELVDIRSEGGYVVAAGSESEKGPYTMLQDVKQLLPFPKSLFPEKKVDIFQVPETAHYGTPKKELVEYPGYGTGQRNEEMTKYIGYVLARTHPADWDHEGWDIIQRANLRNMPPLPQKELLVTFESIKRLERRNNPFGRTSGASGASWGSPQASSEPIILSDGTDEIKHIADVAEEQHIDQTDIYPLQMKCFDDAILGGVGIGDVVVIAGQTGHGKTTLSQDWTMSMVRGDKKVRALWFSYEVLVSHLWDKFQAMGMTREDCVFIPAKHSDGNVAWIEKKIKEGKEKFGIKAVFIDHLGFLLPKTTGILGKNLSSNYASFLTQVMRDLKTIALREEIIIFLPVHMKKPDHYNKRADIDDIKDSSGVGQEADLVFLIERERNKGQDAKSYFTDVTKIVLAKNRKTGITVVGKFSMINGRFAYDATSDKLDVQLDELVKKTSAIVSPVIPQQSLPVEGGEGDDMLDDMLDKTGWDK